MHTANATTPSELHGITADTPSPRPGTPESSGPGRLAVAVSGGTDSLMSLVQLARSGQPVIALHAFFLPPDQGRLAVAEALAGICRRLGVPFFVEDLSQVFDREIITPFALAYASGLTPNPCARCNRRMKFGALFEAARRHGADRLATGHYAGLKRDTQGRAALVRGLDDTRDQSYFLSLVPIEVLGQACFPLAGQRKTDVRRRLAQLGFAPPLPCESRDICFVSDNDYKQFLLERGVALPGEGPILLENGHEIGRHQGLWRHTIGQRRGLRIPYREPLYVVAKDVARNTLVVGPQEALAVSGCRVTAGNTLVSAREWPRELVIQTCYRMRPRPVRTAWQGDTLAVRFFEPLPRPAPGQLAVLYDLDGRVLAGGLIGDSSFSRNSPVRASR